jgi:hypothetical protein
MSSAPLDLHALDRNVARANDALVRFRAALVRDPESAGETDPLAAFRQVAGQKSYEIVTSFPASGLDVPLREALLLWIYALTQARIGRDLEVAWEREAAAPKARVLLETPRDTSYREAWREAVFTRDAGTRRAWLDAAASRGPKLAAIAREAGIRRKEVAERLGFAHPAAPASPFSPTALRDAAWTLLRASADLLAALRREARVRSPDAAAAGPLPLWIEDGLATDASEGWPARLTPRWLEDSFREMSREARLSLALLPRVAGAATFSRALVAFGRALRGDRRSALPFSIAKDPFHADAHRVGIAFGSLPMRRIFHRKILGLSERTANRQARALARTALYASVWVAVRWLLTDEAQYAKADSWDEITHLVFGAPIEPLFLGAWPSPHGDETSKLEALLTAPALTNLLVGRFDDDWFLNPDAAEWLRARAAGPAREPLEANSVEPGVAASSLARSFEEALG